MWKYLMIGFDKDYFNYCFAEMKNDDNYVFLNNTMGSGFLSKLQKICCTEVVNKKFEVPFKQLWMNSYKTILKDTDNVCFVFSKSQSWLLSYKNGYYIDKLRKLYPNCKIMLYLADIISTYYKFDVDFFKNICDYVITYDKSDSEKYGILYCPMAYAKIDGLEDNIENDVFFCGKAKDRLEDIYDIYDVLNSNGLKCDFYVTDVPKEKIKESYNIHYNEKISYKEYLNHVAKAKGIIEVIQKNSSVATLRFKEALAYGKVLITNNENIETNYNKKQIYVYSNLKEIDIDSISESLNLKFSSCKFDELYYFLEKLCEDK